MPEGYTELAPLLNRHMLSQVHEVMDRRRNDVPLPHSFHRTFEASKGRFGGEDGPFGVMAARLKPLLERYPRRRLSWSFDKFPPDGRDKDGDWYWVSMVPYRLYETFCSQHIHGWWVRINLADSAFEVVSYGAEGSLNFIITMCKAEPETLAGIA